MTYPFIISLPHCAGQVPREIAPLLNLSREEIHDSVDHGTLEIFSSLPVSKVIIAKWNRIFCDLNRNPESRGPKGLIARTDYDGREIFKPGMYPDEPTIKHYIDLYYRPYHEALTTVLHDPAIKGLFDCHSLNGVGPLDAPDAGKMRRDVIISNNGAPNGGAHQALGEPTCPVEILEVVKNAFSRVGFSVAINQPYTGGFITVHYGKRLIKRGGFALQIEMNQNLYLDPDTALCDPEMTKAVSRKVHEAFDEIASGIHRYF